MQLIICLKYQIEVNERLFWEVLEVDTLELRGIIVELSDVEAVCIMEIVEKGCLGEYSYIIICKYIML